MPLKSHQNKNIKKKEEVEDEKVELEERRGKKVKLKRILVPIDGSDYSMRAAKYAIEIAKLQNAQIIFIHIIEPLPYGIDYIGPTFDQYFKDVTNIAHSWFSRIRKIAEIEGINDVKTDVFPDKNFDTIINAIINYASSNSIDLIIMGTKGRTGIAGFLLGSVANGVLQHASCPVMLVK